MLLIKIVFFEFSIIFSNVPNAEQEADLVVKMKEFEGHSEFEIGVMDGIGFYMISINHRETRREP